MSLTAPAWRLHDPALNASLHERRGVLVASARSKPNAHLRGNSIIKCLINASARSEVDDERSNTSRVCRSLDAASCSASPRASQRVRFLPSSRRGPKPDLPAMRLRQRGQPQSAGPVSRHCMRPRRPRRSHRCDQYPSARTGVAACGEEVSRAAPARARRTYFSCNLFVVK